IEAYSGSGRNQSYASMADTGKGNLDKGFQGDTCFSIDLPFQGQAEITHSHEMPVFVAVLPDCSLPIGILVAVLLVQHPITRQSRAQWNAARLAPVHGIPQVTRNTNDIV